MLASILPTGLSVYGLFQPPQELNQTLLAAWMIAFTVLSRLSFTFFQYPTLPWPRNCPSTMKSNTIMTYRIALGWLVGVIFIFCMYSLMFAARNTQMVCDPRHYAGFGLLLSVLMVSWIPLPRWAPSTKYPTCPSRQKACRAFA